MAWGYDKPSSTAGVAKMQIPVKDFSLQPRHSHTAQPHGTAMHASVYAFVYTYIAISMFARPYHAYHKPPLSPPPLPWPGLSACLHGHPQTCVDLCCRGASARGARTPRAYHKPLLLPGGPGTPLQGGCVCGAWWVPLGGRAGLRGKLELEQLTLILAVVGVEVVGGSIPHRHEVHVEEHPTGAGRG